MTELKTNTGTNNGRIFYLDFLRVAAMFAVIVLHTASHSFKTVGLNNSQWSFINIYDSLVRWAVPVFTMVSGTMFLDNSRELPLKKLYLKYVLRIVIAFLFWSMLGYFTDVLLGKDALGIKRAIPAIAAGHFHLWFLYMIVGLYIVTPILRKVTADRKTTEYFLIVASVFTFVIPTALAFLKLHGGWMYELTDSVINSKMLVKLVLGYSPYFVLGYWLHNTEISKKAEICIYIAGVIGFALTILMTDRASNLHGSASEEFYRYYCLNVLAESIAVFVFAKQRIDRIGDSGFRKLIFGAAKLSFGVYLVHAILRDLFVELVVSPTAFPTVVSIPMITLAIFAGSLAVSFVLNKIPIVKKYLV